MANEPIIDANAAVTETNAAEPVSDKPKTRAPRKKTAQKSKGTETASASTAIKVDTKSTRTPMAATKSEPAGTQSSDRKRTKYTPAQRASLLASIEKATKGGKTLKAALQQAEVSEQTYYNWKNAAARKTTVPSAGSSDDDLATLVALEAENLKLRKELAAKLRAENEELRRRLDLA